ncbi:acetylornithine transaminase [Paenibacillus sacheonensis]|uniref:Acetylornithine aminotransferase n=1 Tax=Paenibacillus sacheonensis TaxID=742054 RepID=A0A7X5C588_9BACL|nr:acetylornithine transaminase [Paenibacillus sacheonensis]MBM7566446.1 acetylornithine aminotransferase [Paenibacillus sacheonensis]NBC73129.1 acetylornithine transaminase [Paenibacillus sacheonensis]
MSDLYKSAAANEGSSLFPTYARYPISLVKGEGSWLWDDQGNKYLDFMCGIAVTNLGHAPKQVKDALVKQLDELWHVSNLFHIPNQEAAAKLLTDNSHADAVFFCSTGAEANEAAIKLARRYQQKVKGNGRYEILTFAQSFHGRTLATLTATGQEKVKEGFLPLPEGFRYIPLHDIEALEAAITDKTAAVMIETIQAEGGIIPVEPAFLQHLAKMCKEHGVLLIVDEIQTGMGRTGKMFGFQHYGIEPDIFTLAKGLGSGFPVGAMLAKGELAEAFSAGSHGSTFGGTPIATAVVKATIETLLKEKATDRAAETGEYLMNELRAKLAGNPFVKEVRGKGLLVGIECAGPVAPIISEGQQRGLLVITAGPNVVRLLPSLLVSREEVDQAVSILTSIFADQTATAQL